MFNSYTGEHIIPSQLIEYDITKILPPQYSKLATKLWEVPELYDSTHPIIDSQIYTKILSEQSEVELYVVTVSSPKVIARKFEYIHKNFPWIKQDHIIIMNDKSLLNLDILVDDYYKNLIYGKYHKILFNAPWNYTFNASKNGMVRVDSWAQAYSEIQRKVNAKRQVYELEH